jgi:hypothetical protein
LGWRKREKEKKREGGVEKEVDRRKEKEREGEKFCSFPRLSEKLKYESL